ncbi:Alpha/Beta hydrolase protein [Flagelloscypha sp. PMI_526]|nr:Alpha/Beta hydrolase protein [Flagelloscypha sp. PMI_526]
MRLYLIPVALFFSLVSAADPNPVIDLNEGGKWKGILQNNGTVKSWKAIPYASPPLGDLRFKAPRPLAAQNSSVQDVSQDFDGQPTACVQWGTTVFSGVNAGPGVEDCLKLWIWAPANAAESEKLPVQLWFHGGGLQLGQSPSDDFSDWASSQPNVLFVNANYRLGFTGFSNLMGAIYEGEPGNVGLLDQRLAMEWVRKYISKFGGDPNQVTIGGQSGGGGAIMTQLVLFNGENPPFHKANPRSISTSTLSRSNILLTRNDAFASSLNCTTSSASKDGALQQIACLRSIDVQTIRLAAPHIDGRSLFDRPAKLFKEGKFAKVPVMREHFPYSTMVTEEYAEFAPVAAPGLDLYARVISGNLASQSFVDSLSQLYPPPLGFANYSYDTGTFPDDAHRLWKFFDESNPRCAVSMIARAASKHNIPVYELRFNAPQPGYAPYLGATHWSDNFYLQNATSTFGNQTMVDVALEWRAYLASFIRHSDPNVEKLQTSLTWRPTVVEERYEQRMVISLKLENTPIHDKPTLSGMEIQDRSEFDRCSFWLSDDTTAEIWH